MKEDRCSWRSQVRGRETIGLGRVREQRGEVKEPKWMKGAIPRKVWWGGHCPTVRGCLAV